MLDEVIAMEGNGEYSKSNIYSGQCLHDTSDSPLNTRKVPNHTSTPRKIVPHIPRSHEQQNIAGLLKDPEPVVNRVVHPCLDIAERGEGEGSSEPDVETGEIRNSYTKLLMEGADLKPGSPTQQKNGDEKETVKKKDSLEGSIIDIQDKEARRPSDCLGLDDSHESLSFRKSVSETQRAVSISSEEHNEEHSGTGKFLGMESAEKFEELLKKSTKPSLENFSINSFDSDSAPCSRFDSTASDYIESIPEVNESSPKHLDVGPSPSAEEVFLKIGESGSDAVPRPINRHLQKVITEESPMPKINALKIEDIKVTPDPEPYSGVEGSGGDPTAGGGTNIIDSPPERLVHHDPILGLDVSTKGPDSSSFTGSFEEPSIYDIHRHTDTDSGSINLSIDLVTEQEKSSKPKLLDPTSPTEGDDQRQDSDDYIPEHKDVKKQNVITPSDKCVSEKGTSKETSPKQESLGKESRERKGSGSVSPTKRGRPPLTRIQSGERSLETDLRRSRKRTLSGVFGELDLAEDGGREAVHLPEGCVRQWAAEMVTAIACLHNVGIICRQVFYPIH